MASRYWVGGTATWDATAGTKWATTSAGAGGSAVPTAADDVFLDASSGANTVTTSGTASVSVCRSITCTGFTGTLSLANVALALTIGDASGGAATFVSGMTLTVGGSTTSVAFVSTSNNGGVGWSIASGGKSLPTTNFTGAGGGWVLQDNLAFTGGGSAAISHTNGTLDLNGRTITASGSFSASGSSTRTLTMGAATINLSGGGTSWNVSTITNLTISSNTATVNISGSNTTTQFGTINYNGTTFNITGLGTATIAGTTTIANLNRIGTALKTDGLSISNNFTVTGILNLTGNSVTNRLNVISSVVGTARIATVTTTWTCSNVDFMDITAAGAASANLSAITGGSGDCGGNSGFTLTTAATQTATGTASFFWSTHSWTTRVPLPQDNVVINNSFIAGRTITVDMPRLGKSIDSSGSTGAPTLAFGTASAIFGSLTLAANNIFSGTTPITFQGRSTCTLTSSGVTFTMAIFLNAFGGTLTFADAYNTNRNPASNYVITVTNGTLDAATNNPNITMTGAGGGVAISGGTLNMGSGNWSIGATTAFNIWNATGGTINGGTSNIILTTSSASTRTFLGNGGTYGSLTYTVAGSTGQLTIADGNSFQAINFSDASNARTLQLTSATITTITTVGGFKVRGRALNLVTISAVTPASAATLQINGGVNYRSDYLSVQDITGTGGENIFMGSNSINVSGNSGLRFENPPTGMFGVFG